MTGHSLGAAIAELLTCEHSIPAVTFDSPGILEIINNDNNVNQQNPRFKNHLNNIPIIQIFSGKNEINTTNGHVGRLFKIPDHWLALELKGNKGMFSEFDNFPYTVVTTIAKKLGLETFREVICSVILNNTFKDLPEDLLELYNHITVTIKHHSLKLFLKYFQKIYYKDAPNSLSLVLKWPCGIQDGITKPEEKPKCQRIIPTKYFDPETQIILHSSKLLVALNDFPKKYKNFQIMLAAIQLTDENGGQRLQKDHLSIRGLLSADEYRLYVWHHLHNPQHTELQNFLKEKCKNLQLQKPVITLNPTASSSIQSDFFAHKQKSNYQESAAASLRAKL